jgi:hypothetical protein
VLIEFDDKIPYTSADPVIAKLMMVDKNNWP